MDKQYHLVKREVKTLASVFSAVGGFADTIFVGLSILLLPFKTLNYSHYVFKKLYKVERKKKSKRNRIGNSREKLNETKLDAKEVLESGREKYQTSIFGWIAFYTCRGCLGKKSMS